MEVGWGSRIKVMAKKESNKRDQYTVVLEDLRSQFKFFCEALTVVRDEGRANFLKLSRHIIKVEERVAKVEERIAKIDENVLKIEERLVKSESDMEIVKSELAIIRHNQITRSEFQLLETRARRLENLSITHH